MLLPGRKEFVAWLEDRVSSEGAGALGTPWWSVIDIQRLENRASMRARMRGCQVRHEVMLAVEDSIITWTGHSVASPWH